VRLRQRHGYRTQRFGEIFYLEPIAA
jgi:hypothetical protein